MTEDMLLTSTADMHKVDPKMNPNDVDLYSNYTTFDASYPHLNTSYPNNASYNTERMDIAQTGASLSYNGFQNYLARSTEQAVKNTITLYLSPILLTLGGTGNVISFLVLKYQLAKQKSIFFYMALYALTNTLNLSVACGLDWISYVTGTQPIMSLADWICRIWMFTFSVMHHTSTWLVVLMVFDRFIYLCVPSRAHSLCSVFSAKVFTCFVVVILIVISIHAMWTYELIQGEQCNIDARRKDFQTTVWPFIAAVIYIYLPLVLIIIFDILIVVNMAVLNARQYQGRNYSPLQQQLTSVVLVISVTFLIFTFPAIILNLVDWFNPELSNTYESAARIYLANFICESFLWLLCGLNFLQYFIPLPLLRKEFRLWIRQIRCRKKPAADKTNGIETTGRLLQNETNEELKQNGVTVITQV